jgi:hypothetical protein
LERMSLTSSRICSSVTSDSFICVKFWL